MRSQVVVLVACLLFNINCVAVDDADEHPAHLAITWNEFVLGLAEAEDGFLTLKGLRATTMMHIAMHDALVNIDGRYAGYALNQQNSGADPLVAVTQAAFTVVANQYPDQLAAIREVRSRWLPEKGATTSVRAGIDLGTAAAEAILRQRTNDGWDTEAEYEWHPMAPGVYAEFPDHSGTPQGFIFGSGWGKAKGFALESASEFRAPPPPEISSSAYTQAFDEVKKLGRFQSMTRAPDQTHIALWWKDFAENSHNRLARDLIAKEQLGLRAANQLFVMLNMSIFDAYVSSFDNKFHYNHWRPYTAIRWAENDGNPDTIAEKTWTNTHRHTYAFPSYPSAHGMACAAAMTAFTSVFGEDYAFTMRTPMVDIAGPLSGKIEMNPPTRNFGSFSDAAMECALSRVYLGIHFRYDSIEGNRLGVKVGEAVTQRFPAKN